MDQQQAQALQQQAQQKQLDILGLESQLEGMRKVSEPIRAYHELQMQLGNARQQFEQMAQLLNQYQQEQQKAATESAAPAPAPEASAAKA